MLEYKNPYTKEEQAEHRSDWVKALRSGKYKRAVGQLHDADGNYCVLGVACDISGLGEWTTDFELPETCPYDCTEGTCDCTLDSGGFMYHVKTNESYRRRNFVGYTSGGYEDLPTEVSYYYGISKDGSLGVPIPDEEQNNLAYLNDMLNERGEIVYTFDKLADLIEKEKYD